MDEDYKKWAWEYVVSGIPYLIAPAILVAFWSKSILSVLSCVGAGLFVMVCGVITKGKSDRWLWGLVAFGLSIYFANWFFGDIKKTLGIPLAFIFYVIGKTLSPSPLKPVLDSMENFFNLRLLTSRQNADPNRKRKSNSERPHEKLRNINYQHTKNNRKIVRRAKRYREGF